MDFIAGPPGFERKGNRSGFLDELRTVPTVPWGNALADRQANLRMPITGVNEAPAPDAMAG
jgi:hypothetical protein